MKTDRGEVQLKAAEKEAFFASKATAEESSEDEDFDDVKVTKKQEYAICVYF